MTRHGTFTHKCFPARATMHDGQAMIHPVVHKAETPFDTMFARLVRNRVLQRKTKHVELNVVAIDGTSRSAYSIQGLAEEGVIIRVPEGSLQSVSAMKIETPALLRGTTPHDVLAFSRAAGERNQRR